MKCRNCGAENPVGQQDCMNCDYPLESAARRNTYQEPVKTKVVSSCNRWIAFALCFLCGGIGIHRFYVGKIGTGVLYLLTGGLFGIGWLVDLIMIACGSFTDKSGAMLKE